MSSTQSTERKPNIAKAKVYKTKTAASTIRTSNTSTIKFEGETDELSGHIYDINTSQQSELFTNTTKKIANYAGRNCKESKDISLAIENLEEPTWTLPVKQTTGDKEVDSLLLVQELQLHIRRKHTYNDNRSTLFHVVMGQCTDSMKAKLEAESTYDTIANDRDVIKLLKLMRDIAFNYESDRYPFLALHLGMKQFYSHYQKFAVPCDTYLDSYNNLQDVVEHCGGNIGNHPSLLAYTYKLKNINETTTDSEEIKTVLNATKESYGAIAFLCGLNQTRFQGLMDELANSYLNGRDEYPKTIVAAYNLVLHWAGGNKTAPTGQNDAVSFNTIDEEADVNTTSGGVILRKDGLPVKCVICGDNHWPNKCPNKQRRRFTRNNDPISETAATPTTTHNTSNSSGSGAAANVTTDNSTLSTPTNEVANVTISDQPDPSGDWNQYYSGVSFFTMTHNVHADLLKNITDAIDYDHILEQSDGKINPNWTLLDNQSTVDVFSNPAFLMQIHQVSKGLRIFSTGGSTTTDWIGLLPNYGWVWFSP